MTSFTGLNNPYGAYKQFVSLIYLGGLVTLKGAQEPYVDRAARKVHKAGLNLISYAKADINLKSDRKRLINDLRAAASYLEQVQALEHTLPGFKGACRHTERDILALVDTIEGRWAQRMYPIFSRQSTKG